MNLEQIKELMSSMDQFQLSEISVEDGSGFKVNLKKECKNVAFASAIPLQQHHQAQHLSHVAQSHVVAPNVVTHKEEHKEKPGVFITSPMVGTFYKSPSPQDPPFVKVGDHVTENTVVCIIEAMKVMNEIKAQKAGKIVEIVAENMHAVEYGSKLFRIE